MKKTLFALLACCGILSAKTDISFLPYVDTEHPERYHLSMDSAPLICHTAHPHFKIFYFDNYGEVNVIFKVSCIKVDEMGVYFEKADILGKKVCQKKK